MADVRPEPPQVRGADQTLAWTLVVVLITSLATVLPARRASRVDPIRALRGE